MRNIYGMDIESHEKLLRENITKTYKKADGNTIKQINGELKTIANDLNIGDRIDVMAKRQAFNTLKDHKDNFENNSTWRLAAPRPVTSGWSLPQLVGLFMLNKLSQKFKNNDNIGLYRDDGLAAFRNMGPKCIVCKATVHTDDPQQEKIYIGSTEGEFKKRYGNHKMSPFLTT